MKRSRLAIVVLLLLSSWRSAVFAGEPGINIYVASRAYIVSVAPVDEQSRDAENSLLYQRTSETGEWQSLGPCRKETLPNRDVRFTREVEVERDGTYYYTSRPVVGGKVESPPRPESPAQAVVTVDTLTPVAELLSPVEGHKAIAGQAVGLAWKCSDENFPPLPAALSYSTDGGKSWNRIAADLPAEGDMSWKVPETLAGPVAVRLAATDKAGNVGRDLRRMEVSLPEPTAKASPAIEKPHTDTAKAKDDESSRTPPEKSRDSNRSWLYYLMAINQMRQNKPRDALQYYWLAVKEDPDFIDAWADIGLAYIDLGAYRTAREVVEQTRDKDPNRIDLMHLMGETYHAEGMALLGEAKSSEDRLKAKGLIDQAVEWYGRALDKAAKDWRLAEQAASFYRLGEVCYYVNMDRDGARAYWKKILELHSPTPNADLVLWTPASERDKAKQRYQRYTYQRVSLEAWQNWARGYLEQLDARERAGILDLMPAQRITAIPTPQPLGYSGNSMNPGRDDGRSLFSLPAQLGSPSPTAASVGYSSGGGAPERQNPGISYKGQATEGYSFYADKEERGRGGNVGSSSGSRRDGRSVFTGGPDRPPPPNPDPYAFPQGNRTQPAWNSYGPYGDQPVNGW